MGLEIRVDEQLGINIHRKRLTITKEPSNDDEILKGRVKKVRKQKDYIPKYRSGAYAILLALHNLGPSRTPPSFSKEEIIAAATPYSETSLINPSTFTGTNARYTAWASMSTLLEKMLVWKHQRGRKVYFELTEEGKELAEKLSLASGHQSDDLRIIEPSLNVAEKASHSNYGTAQSQTVMLNENSNSQQVIDIESNHHGSINTNYTISSGSRMVDLSYSPNSVGDLEVIPNRSISAHFPYIYLTIDGTKTVERARAAFSFDEDRQELCYKIMAYSTPPPQFTNMFSNIQPANAFRDLNPADPWTAFLPESASHEQAPGLQSTSTVNNSSSHSTTAGREPVNIMRSSSISIIPARTNLRRTPSTVTVSEQSSSRNLADILNLIKKFQLNPGCFQIYLVVDNRETFASHTRINRDKLTRALQDQNIKIIRRALDVGDMIWIAKPIGSVVDKEYEELVLDCIVERKRGDDLLESYKDGRFREQRYRLDHCGIERITYIIEAWDEKCAHYHGVELSTVHKMLSGLQVVHGMNVKMTSSIEDTVRYLTLITRRLDGLYSKKRLIGVDPSLAPSDLPRDTASLSKLLEPVLLPQSTLCLTYAAFSNVTKKRPNITMEALWSKQLCQIPGVSSEKAATVVKRFPLAMDLVKAYRRKPEADRDDLVYEACDAELLPRRRITKLISQRIRKAVYP